MITTVAPIAMIAKKLASVAVWISVCEFQKLLTVCAGARGRRASRRAAVSAMVDERQDDDEPGLLRRERFVRSAARIAADRSQRGRAAPHKHPRKRAIRRRRTPRARRGIGRLERAARTASPARRRRDRGTRPRRPRRAARRRTPALPRDSPCTPASRRRRPAAGARTGSCAPPPVSSSWLGATARAPARIDSESRSAKQTPSSTARVRCARECARLSPRNAPRIDASRCGVRSPCRYGRNVTPSAPGGTVAASALSRVVGVRRAGELARELVAIPGERAARRQHDAHQVPDVRHDVAERVRAQPGIDARLRPSARAPCPTCPSSPPLRPARPRRRPPRRTRCRRRRRRPASRRQVRSAAAASARHAAEHLGRSADVGQQRVRQGRRRRGSRCSSAGAPCRTSASPTRRTARWRATPVRR